MSWELTKLIGWGQQRVSFSVFIFLAGIGVLTEKGGGNPVLPVVRVFDMILCDVCWEFRLLGWTSLSNPTGFICATSTVGRLEIPLSSDSAMSRCF